MTLEISEIGLPESAESPEWQAFIGLINRDNREHIGGAQWDEDPSTSHAQWRAARYSQCRRWLASVDGEAVGCAFGWWQTRDDPDLASVHCYVAPEFRCRGIGTALAVRVRAGLKGGQVRRAIVEVNTLPRSEAPLTGPGGVGAVDGEHPGVRMALREGFSLAQTAVWSRYDIHGAEVDPEAVLAAAGEVAGDDYEVVAWEGPASVELLEGLAVLKERMRTDMPAGGLEFAASVWDVARVREDDERRLLGHRLWRVAVRHRPSGTLVALTELQQLRAQPRGFVGQWDTVVLPEHRGRRLGLMVKAANILQVRGTVAEGVEINACNAAENAHMLAINRELGFREYLWVGTFAHSTG